MSIDLIRYDRIWLQEYIGAHIPRGDWPENYMMHFRQHCMGTSEDKILSYKTALGHTRELIDSRSDQACIRTVFGAGTGGSDASPKKNAWS